MKKLTKFLFVLLALACVQPSTLYAASLNQTAHNEYVRFNNPIHRSVLYLDWQTYQTYVVQAHNPVLILFTNANSYASNNELGWYMELAYHYNTVATFAVVETNQHPRLAAYLHYQTAPSLYLIGANKSQVQINQYMPKEQLDSVVIQFLDANP